MKPETLEKEIIDFITLKHPKALDDFKIVIKEIGDSPSDIQIQDLVYFARVAQKNKNHPTAFSSVYDPVWALANIFHDYKKMKMLGDLSSGRTIAKLFRKTGILPMSLIEQVVFRDTSVIGFKVSRSYTLDTGSTWYLGEFIRARKYALSQLAVILEQLIVENNIKTTPFALLDFKSAQPSGMPEIK